MVLFFTLGSGVEKYTASTETLWAEAKAQGPGRDPLTLRPEREKNKHTPRRHWSLCRPPRGNGPQGGVRQQDSPQTSKFTPPKKISRQIPVKGGIEGDHPRGGNIKAEKKETCCKCSVMQRRLGHECPSVPMHHCGRSSCGGGDFRV